MILTATKPELIAEIPVTISLCLPKIAHTTSPDGNPLISKKAKLKLYFSVIRPVATYACETWILKETITNRLLVFERKILMKIFGQTYVNGSWQIKTNQELDKIIKHKNIINFARAQRLGLYGHIERMQETRIVKAIHSWKPISKRPTGRPKIR